MTEVMTEKGIEIVKNKLQTLKLESEQVMSELKDARGNSLSNDDNTEVDQYTQRYESLQRDINNLKAVLDNAKVIDISTITCDKVRFGSIVKLLNVDDDVIISYQILSTYESDPRNNIISYTSPLGKEMLGLTVGDFFEIMVADRFVEYEILEIKRGE